MISHRSASAFVLVTLIVLSATLAAIPPVPAGAPEQQSGAYYDVENEITGIAADARAAFTAVTVQVAVTSGGLIGSDAAEDVYAFDFSEKGRGLQWKNKHADTYRAGKVPTSQSVAFAAGEREFTLGRFAVGGPGDVVSRWNTNSQKADWEKTVEITGPSAVADVAITSDAGRVIALANPTTTTAAGRIFVYEGVSGKYVWDSNLTNTAGQSARGTVLEMARADSRTLVVGTDKGFWIVDATTNSKPSQPFKYDTEGAVTAIDVSRDGKYVLVGDSEGHFYYFGPGARSQDSPAPYNRGMGSAIADVAMSLDGKRFTVGTVDGTVYFYERTSDATETVSPFADPVTKESKYKLGGRVVDLDYDASGQLLVAVTEGEVAGFHDTRVSPVWTLAASKVNLDTPLKGAVVADNGERVVVAGRTAVTALKVVYAADVTVQGGLARSALPGDTVRYTALVKNTGSAPDTYTWRVTAPAGWTFDQPRTLTLLPDESQSVQLNLTSPTGSRPGFAETRVVVESTGLRDQGKDPVVKDVTLNVTLSRIVDVVLESAESGLTMNQGQEAVYPFTITNRGNDEVLVNLSAQQQPSRGSSWTIRFDEEQIRVGPGGSATSSLTLAAPVDGFDGDFNRVTVRATVGNTFATRLDFTARVNPEFNIDVEANETSVVVRPGRTTFVQILVTNSGNTADTVNLTASVLPTTAARQWRVTLDRESIEVPRGQTRTVNLGIKAVDPDAEEASVTIALASAGNGERESVTVTARYDPTEAKQGLLGLPAPGLPLAVLAIAFAFAFTWRPRSGRRT